MDNNHELPNSKATEINEPQKEKLVTDTSILGIEKTDSLNKTAPKEVSRVPLNRDPQIRLGEGVSDAKLNGEQILLQEELSEKILLKNPDTIKYYLKQIYLGQEQNFPRSIADDFEHGISKEYISYPKLNFKVELFEDQYAKKPYKILGFSVRKENDQIIVE